MDEPSLIPPPLEYVRLTQERALWEGFGRRPDDIGARDYYEKVHMLQLEAANARKKKR